MSRIFAFTTFLCLLAIIVMGIAVPGDPLFLFAANGPTANILRGLLAIAMLAIAFGPEIKNFRLRSVIGVVGFSLIALGVLVLAGTGGAGIYPLLQPVDLLTAIIVGVTCSIVVLETQRARTSVIPDRYFFYQDLEPEPEPRKRIKAIHRPA